MLRRTRVSSTPDTARIAKAVQRPGIDPRIWCAIAIATDEAQLDPAHGDYVDIRLLPHGEAMTAAISPRYAGPKFGDREGRVHKNDGLCVVIPSGDPAEGVHVVAKLWNAADTPPDLAVQNPEDLVRVVEMDKWIRILLQGSGQWHLQADTATLKAPHVNLGDDAPTEQLVLGTTYRQNEAAMNSSMSATYTATATAFTAALATLSAIPPPTLAGAAVAAALVPLQTMLTSLGTAIQNFEAATAQYLSNVSKTK